MRDHTDFIQKSIFCILEEAIAACSGIGSGIETYTLCDYIMQSVFLRMTGFQEQKMKCICWELATNDYDYRRSLLSNEDKLGECSTYNDKNNIYKRLIEQICKYDPTFKVIDLKKKEIRKDATSNIKYIFSNTNLLIWGQEDFNEYEKIWKDIGSKNFANENKNLFTEITNGISLKYIYENHLYKHRNRIAHNALSYQQNLPTLKTLADENYKYENYFVWFAILALIDKIFIELYNKYLETFKDLI